MKARLYQPSKTATQSGRGRMDCWVLEYETTTARRPEALMGWTASGDTLNQLRLEFPSYDEAMAFARKEGLEVSVSPQHERKVRPRNYADNFRYTPPADQESA